MSAPTLGRIVRVALGAADEAPAIVLAADDATVDVWVFDTAGGRPYSGLPFYDDRAAWEQADTSTVEDPQTKQKLTTRGLAGFGAYWPPAPAAAPAPAAEAESEPED